MSSADSLSKVRAAAIDGRLDNVYFRQDQFRRLHSVLVEREEEALEAIAHDSGHIDAEAKIQYYLVLSSIKRYLSQLDPEKSLQEEYRIANGADALDRVESVGIVYVEPTTHTLFYSALVPIAGALAAGSCVVLQLQDTLLEAPNLVRKILSAALDPDVFMIVQEMPDDQYLGPSFIRILQNGADEPATNTRLVSPGNARVIAVVDRTADIDAAVTALVTARLSFGASSSYAPDLVLVNEFVKAKFLNAVAQQMLRCLTEENDSGERKKAQENLQGDSLVQELQAKCDARVITSSSDGTVAEIRGRNFEGFPRKIQQRCLCVHAVTSLDDAIDLASREDTVLATYLFSNLASAKYLGQFITSNATFVNHIQLGLLVGPAGPSGHVVDPLERYPTALFTRPKPQRVIQTIQSKELSDVLTKGDQERLGKLLEEGQAPLPGDRPYTKGVGFFEQGISTGLSLTAAPVLVSLGVLFFYGTKSALTRWR
ncbi:ALDH-like protein [Saccharata proteae CBS 121410]|uniref:ALDH-like protein n=1 Tax=Saccharata proteae CBS 121410 TaxID=1314787 RepID=A0A9P4I417_9PEZI|nr:ALDH-like protein [Saccharata proteae CBS 121410]